LLQASKGLSQHPPPQVLKVTIFERCEVKQKIKHFMVVLIEQRTSRGKGEQNLKRKSQKGISRAERLSSFFSFSLRPTLLVFFRGKQS